LVSSVSVLTGDHINITVGAKHWLRRQKKQDWFFESVTLEK
jgi:hypothetical protein